MTRKRGAPVLIELITRPSGASVSGAPTPPSQPAAQRGGRSLSDPDTWTASARGGPAALQFRLPALLVGVGVIVVVAAAIVGYQLGQKKERTNWAEGNASGTGPGGGATGTVVNPGNGGTTPGGSVSDPLSGTGGDQNGALGGGVTRPPSLSPPPVAPITPPSLQDGWNYLVVATLRRGDAESAARYLADNGIACQLVPHDRAGVDQPAAAANNALWQVWVLQGVPGGAEFSKHQAAQKALENKIQLLGRSWKAQNRKAPTDFAQVFWKRYKSG